MTATWYGVLPTCLASATISELFHMAADADTTALSVSVGPELGGTS